MISARIIPQDIFLTGKIKISPPSRGSGGGYFHKGHYPPKDLHSRWRSASRRGTMAATTPYRRSSYPIASYSLTTDIIDGLAMNGLDFVIIDCEHAETNTESIVYMCRASEVYGMAPLVRVYDPDDGPMMSRMLDVGVQGVMVPLVNTPQQAQKIVDYTKYAPVGHRGANGGRGPRWGLYDNYTVQANEQCRGCRPPHQAGLPVRHLHE